MPINNRLFKYVNLLLLLFILTGCIEQLTKPDKRSDTNQKKDTTSNTGASEKSDPLKSEQSISVFASNAVDKECKQMVVSTTLADNSAGLLKFSGELAKIKLMDSVGNLINGSGVTSNSLGDAKVKELIWYYSKNYVWLPMTAERFYSDHEQEQFASIVRQRNKKNADIYDYADALLKEVTAAIDEKNDYTFEVFILKRAGENAMALPAGRIYLDEKLVKDRKLHDRAIFAISHEVAHVLQRHETKHIQSRLMDSVDLYDLVGNIQSLQSGKNIESIIAPIIAGKQLFTKNYIDQELQADSCGAKLTAKIMNGDKKRINKTFNDFISRLTKSEYLSSKHKNTPTQSASNMDINTSKNILTLEEFVSSPIEQHPTSQQRYENLKNILMKLQ